MEHDAEPATRTGRAAALAVFFEFLVGNHWHLRRVMAKHGMFQTSDLLLTERGDATREQIGCLPALRRDCRWRRG